MGFTLFVIDQVFLYISAVKLVNIDIYQYLYDFFPFQ
jgi:hypothetical protein